MAKIEINELLSSTRNADLNTWERYHKVMPNIIKTDFNITLKTDMYEVKITSHEEVILHIIQCFQFCPIWLVEKFLNENKLNSMEDPVNIIKSWINIGLVWIEGSVTGEYLRPTYFMYKLFGKEGKTFSSIPFNKLTHTISEQQVMYEVMSGIDNKLNKTFNKIFVPRYSELGINCQIGTNIIREEEFRSISVFMSSNIPEIEQSEYEIREEIRNGKKITPELRDFKKFLIIKKKDNKGSIKTDYDIHIPDLIIPLPRYIDKNTGESKALSIAIEVELTKKSLNSYIHIMNKFKDNNKFGYLVYYCANGKIAELIKKAYNSVNGLGHTQLVIYEFVIPSPSSIYKIK